MTRAGYPAWLYVATHYRCTVQLFGTDLYQGRLDVKKRYGQEQQLDKHFINITVHGLNIHCTRHKYNMAKHYGTCRMSITYLETEIIE